MNGCTYSNKKNIEEQRKKFEKDDKNFLQIYLEVRKSFRKNFHDRFLIFPSEKPKVWSLGTSVNGVGKSHHIIQEVQNAQHILDEFNKLWDESNQEKFLVWKST